MPLIGGQILDLSHFGGVSSSVFSALCGIGFIVVGFVYVFAPLAFYTINQRAALIDRLGEDSYTARMKKSGTALICVGGVMVVASLLIIAVHVI